MTRKRFPRRIGIARIAVSRTAGHVLAVALTAGAVGAASAVNPGPNWGDSVSDGDQCYCDTTYDHGIGTVEVETPVGIRTVRQICERIGPPPDKPGLPVYNDIQCGNGPPNDAGDEDPDVCPGRVDQGSAGCFVIGPTWNLERFFEADPSAPSPETPPAQDPDVPAVGGANPSDVDTPAGRPIDALSFSTADDRWQPIEGAYLELLPDRRVATTDPPERDTFWERPEEAPQVHYTLDIDAPGRYEVLARTRSAGAHDGSAWVGLDGIWSSTPMESCSPSGTWLWTDCHAGAEPSVVVDVAGTHTLMIGARDDGFEFDRLVLRGPIGEEMTGEPLAELSEDGGGGGASPPHSLIVLATAALFRRLSRTSKTERRQTDHTRLRNSRCRSY